MIVRWSTAAAIVVGAAIVGLAARVVVVPVLYAMATLALTLRWTYQTQRRHDM